MKQVIGAVFILPLILLSFAFITGTIYALVMYAWPVLAFFMILVLACIGFALLEDT